jgi:hypothetical protein
LALEQADWLTQQDRESIRARHGVTREGVLIVRSEVHKEQERNRQLCRDKLQALVREVKTVLPERVRVEVPVETQEMEEKRLRDKRMKSDRKKERHNRFF